LQGRRAVLRHCRKDDIGKSHTTQIRSFAEVALGMSIPTILGFVLGFAGSIAAIGLLAGLIAGHSNPRWRIWPAPPAGSVKSFAFWTLFRVLNVVVLVLTVGVLVAQISTGHIRVLQVALAGLGVSAFAVYLCALWALGRDATYCRASGLNTGGIYRWTRNPQYATAILAYSALGLAAADPLPMGLAFALGAVYAGMAITEEPWLAATYGSAYERYRESVPRFFNFARLRRLLVALYKRRRLSELR
jgi:protein-S-isoprenylcysteine O-methyltransferase Ste14